MKSRANIHTGIYIIAVIFTLSVFSCKSEKNRPEPAKTDFELGMAREDSLEVKRLINEFFQYATDKNYTEAAGMLYKNDSADIRKEPLPLNNEEMARVRNMLEVIPVEGYRIEYMKFSESHENEVLCHVIIRKGNGRDIPEMTTKMFFKPISYLGGWCLGIMNTEWGDRGIVDPDKRDSVGKAYKEQEKKETKEDTTGK